MWRNQALRMGKKTELNDTMESQFCSLDKVKEGKISRND